MDNVYLCFNIEKDNLKDAFYGLKALGVEGFNVTMPYKEDVMEFIDTFSKEARGISAVNTVYIDGGKTYGHNTDATGFIRGLKEESSKGARGDTVLLLGAGGAAKALAYSLLEDKCKKLYVYNRTYERALKLKELDPRVEVIGEVSQVIDYVDLIVNTTSVGMDDLSKSPLPDSIDFKSKQRLVDIIYKPWDTKLMLKARADGAFSLNGFPMLFWQAVEAYELWNGITIEKVQIDEIRGILKEKGIIK